MADFSKVGLNVFSEILFPNIKELFISAAKMFNGTADLNVPDGTIRWSSANKRFEIYDAGGDAWGPLLDMTDDTVPYLIRVQEANHADDATSADDAAFAGHADEADLAANATNFGGLPPADYRKTSDVIPTTNGGTGASSAATAPFPQKSLNLSDMNATTMRANLNLTSAATTPVGTSGSYLTTNDRVWAIAKAVANAPTYTTTSLTVTAGTGTVTMTAPAGYRYLCGSSHPASISSTGASITLNRGAYPYDYYASWVKNA